MAEDTTNADAMAAAAGWILRAAERGHQGAQLEAGRNLLSGRWVTRNPANAAKWFTMAAEGPDESITAKARDYLWFCRATGQGLPQSPDDSVQWYCWFAEESPGTWRKQTEPFARACGLTPAQARAAMQPGVAVVAARGDGRALYALGVCHMNGDGVKQDQAEALRWFREAAAQGHAEARTILAVEWVLGNHADQPERHDTAELMQWLHDGAGRGNAKALNALGVVLCRGESITRDPVRGVVLIRTAAGRGHPPAQRNLGLLYAAGDCVRRSRPRAIFWLEKAAAADDSRAQSALGQLYMEGKGRGRNVRMGLFWYRMAAAQGDKQAISALQFHELGKQSRRE